LKSGIERNSLLFFGKSTRQVTHVAIAINDNQMIEAAGEGKESTSLGMIRLRPIHSRRDMVGAICMQ
jgi:cell wall-associated NlpC family hydrolase